MSTRSVIARTGKTEGEFAGVYSHWDGMPISRGPLLWKIVHKEFKDDLKAALAYLIDKHPAGWSSLDKRNCYCHPHLSKDATHKGRKPEPANKFTHEHVVKGHTDIEWLYAFDEERNRLFIRDIGHDAETLIELADAEPDWAVVECGEHFERCRHYGWFHGLLPKTSSLSTQKWLEREPLGFRDAVAFIINGKRFTSTGSGGHSDFFNTPLARQHRGNAKPFPPSTWVASVKGRDGRRADFPVALIEGNEHKPFPGVAWVLPPTKNNPSETIVGGVA